MKKMLFAGVAIAATWAGCVMAMPAYSYGPGPGMGGYYAPPPARYSRRAAPEVESPGAVLRRGMDSRWRRLAGEPPRG